MPLSAHTNHESGCLSPQPPFREADSNPLSRPQDHDEWHKPYQLRSQERYLPPYAYDPQRCQSYRGVGTMTVHESNVDSISLSIISMSSHGPERNSSHFDSRDSFCSVWVSEPRGDSMQLTPTSVNTAPPPDYTRPSSPLAPRTVIPMSTASIPRWNRNIIVSVRLTPVNTSMLIRDMQSHGYHILPCRTFEI